MVTIKYADSKIKELKEILPGFLLAVLVGYFSFLLSEIIGEDILSFEKSPISPVMLAIIIGILVSNLISIPKSCDSGLIFSGKKVFITGHTGTAVRTISALLFLMSKLVQYVESQ